VTVLGHDEVQLRQTNTAEDILRTIPGAAPSIGAQVNNGNGGSGWLELSWANFLGGPWHNQRVKDGSWTMNRIEGQWCLEGNRGRPRRVTHDNQGRLSIVTEDGTRMGGEMQGPYFVLDNGEETLKGDMFYKGNKITFPNGAFWTWCGRLSD